MACSLPINPHHSMPLLLIYGSLEHARAARAIKVGRGGVNSVPQQVPLREGLTLPTFITIQTNKAIYAMQMHQLPELMLSPGPAKQGG